MCGFTVSLIDLDLVLGEWVSCHGSHRSLWDTILNTILVLSILGTGFMPQIIRMCVYGSEEETPVIGQDPSKTAKAPETM